MARTIPTVEDRSLQRIAAQVRRLENELESLRRQLRATSCELGDAWAYVAKAPAGGIAAQGGDTPGSASCPVYKLDAGDWASAGFFITVYNMAEEAVTGSAYIQCKRDGVTGVFVADFERCSPEA